MDGFELFYIFVMTVAKIMWLIVGLSIATIVLFMLAATIHIKQKRSTNYGEKKRGNEK